MLRLVPVLACSHRNQALDTIHTSFPRALTPFILDYLAVSLTHLVALFPTFAHYYISSSDSVPRTSEDETIELPQLICPIMDFMAGVSRGGKAKDWWTAPGNLPHLVSSVFNFVQMTDEDVSHLDSPSTSYEPSHYRKKPGRPMPTHSSPRKRTKRNLTVLEWLALIYYQ